MHTYQLAMALLIWHSHCYDFSSVWFVLNLVRQLTFLFTRYLCTKHHHLTKQRKTANDLLIFIIQNNQTDVNI